MAWELDYPEDQHEARLIIEDPVALAYEWIRAYARSISGYDESETITAEELIGTAMSNFNRRENGWSGDSICRGGLLEGMNPEPLFWDKLAVLKGIEIPDYKRENFFTCSC